MARYEMFARVAPTADGALGWWAELDAVMSEFTRELAHEMRITPTMDARHIAFVELAYWIAYADIHSRTSASARGVAVVATAITLLATAIAIAARRARAPRKPKKVRKWGRKEKHDTAARGRALNVAAAPFVPTTVRAARLAACKSALDDAKARAGVSVELARALDAACRSDGCFTSIGAVCAAGGFSRATAPWALLAFACDAAYELQIVEPTCAVIASHRTEQIDAADACACGVRRVA